MVGRRTGRSQSAERILDEERAFTRAELVAMMIVMAVVVMRMMNDDQDDLEDYAYLICITQPPPTPLYTYSVESTVPNPCHLILSIHPSHPHQTAVLSPLDQEPPPLCSIPLHQVKQGSAGSCLSWQSSWAEEGRSSGQEELPLPDDAASHLVDEGIQLNSVGSDSFRQDTSFASHRQNSLLDSSPSRRQGSPSLVGFSLRPSPRRNLANSPRPESQPALTTHQVFPAWLSDLR